MSEQMQLLFNLIGSAKLTRNKEAIETLREICVVAARKAPENDLIKMAEFLYHAQSTGEICR